MNIADLQARQGNVEVIGEIIDISEPKTFQKFGKSGRVATARLQDESGEIKLSLWNEQIDQFKVGDKIRIENGYVNEWQGEKQLTTGKFGKIEKIEMTELKKPQKEALKDDAKIEEMETDEGSRILSDDEAAEEEILDKGFGEPEIKDSVTHDEETEEETLGELDKPGESPAEAESDDEIDEEEISVEEEEVG